jgi:hypothetical protein
MHNRNAVNPGRGQGGLASPFIVNQQHELLTVREAALLDCETICVPSVMVPATLALCVDCYAFFEFKSRIFENLHIHKY